MTLIGLACLEFFYQMICWMQPSKAQHFWLASTTFNNSGMVCFCILIKGKFLKMSFFQLLWNHHPAKINAEAFGTMAMVPIRYQEGHLPRFTLPRPGFFEQCCIVLQRRFAMFMRETWRGNPGQRDSFGEDKLPMVSNGGISARYNWNYASWIMKMM